MKTVSRSCLLGVLVMLASAWAQAGQTNNPVIGLHAQELVILQDNKLVPFGCGTFLKAPYTILYFSAGWCPDCRRFSPVLVGAYNRQAKDKRAFEVLLLSRDKTTQGMLKYMQTEKMPWPALAFDKVKGAQNLQKYYSGHGIPCLSVIDQKGTLILQSKNDQDAAEILGQLQDLVTKRE